MSDPLDAFTVAPAAADPLDAFTTGNPALQAAAAAPDAPLVARIGNAINDIPRQVGLFARDALEGPAGAAQIVTEPIRYFTDRATGMTGKTQPLSAVASNLADSLGLPKPANATERVVNEGAKLGFGAMGPGLVSKGADLVTGAGNAVAPYVAPATTKVGQLLQAMQGAPSALVANPAQQVASAVGAGTAGQASKEAGGSPLAQTAAAVVGGVAGGLTPGAFDSLVGTAKRLVTPNASAQAMEQAFQTATAANGINLGAMAPAARVQLRQDFAQAMNTGGDVSGEALQRLSALRAAGVTPTQGMVSLDPSQVTREQNLAKITAASTRGGVGNLPDVQNANNRALIGRLNELGGDSGVLPITAGRAVLGGVVSKASALGTAEQAAWDAAKSHPGYTAPIFPDGLNAINKALGDTGQMPFMAPGISKYMEAFQTGQQPFTPQAYRNLRSMLSGELSKGGNEAAAAKTAIQALDSSPIRPLTETGVDIGSAPITQGLAGALRGHDAQAQEAIDLVNKARAATAQKYAYQESSPLVKTALGDTRSSDPENLAKSFVLGGTVNDAQHVAAAVGPGGIADIRSALATYIKKQATSGATNDDTAAVSSAALRKTLDGIGNEKLALFFSPEEVAQLRNVSRAADLTQNRPVGSAVNNSNSGTMLTAKALDFLDSKVLRYLPGADYTPGLITAPLRNINGAVAARGVSDVVPGLLKPTAPTAGAGRGLLLPATTGGALFTSGLLGSN